MNVKVLFFGATADSVGVRESEITLENEMNANAAKNLIVKTFPALETNHDVKSLHFAVNQEYANGDEIIKEGDELAVFTAVSGG